MIGNDASSGIEAIAPVSTSPIRRPVMLQGWNDLASVHWPYDPTVVQRLLPAGYRVDTFDGAALVGLIPFLMRRIRIPGLPSFGPLSTFPETNIRTYIVDPAGRRGVWFASLDVTRLLPVLVARRPTGCRTAGRRCRSGALATRSRTRHDDDGPRRGQPPASACASAGGSTLRR